MARVRHALKNRWAVIGLYFVAVTLLALAAGVGADAADLSRESFALLHSAVMLVAMVGAIWVCLYWWRRTDEAAKEAHKWAFFWGATVGVAALGVLLPQLLVGDNAARLASRFGYEGDTELVMFGLLLALVFQTVGYVVAWAVWWLRRR